MEYLFWNGGSALCVKFACMERANENRQSTGYGYNYTTQACERWAMLARNKDDLQLQVRHWSQQLSRASKKTCLRSQLLVVIRAGRQLNQQKGAM